MSPTGESTVVAAVTSAEVLGSKAGNVQKRRVDRVDGLGHLAPQISTDDAERIESVRAVVMYELWIITAGVQTLAEASTGQWQNYLDGSEASYRLKNFIDEDLGPFRSSPGSHRTGELHKARWQRYFETRVASWTPEKLDASISEDIGGILSDILQYQITMVRVTRLTAYEVCGDKNAAIPLWYDKYGIKTRSEYVSALTVSRDERLSALRSFLRLLEDYRDAVRTAAQTSHFSNKQLSSLKSKFEGMAGQFETACKACEYEPREAHLVDVNSEDWWNPPRDTAKNDNTSPSSAPTATAYPKPSTMHSTLIVIVPTVSLLSAIPAALAWTHGSPDPGTTSDSDFYQAIAGAVMQLLGLLTFIWPTLSHPRLSPMAWFWIWIIAAFSAVCAMLSIPLFLAVSSTWSFVVAFAGVLAQAIVQMQVINAI